MTTECLRIADQLQRALAGDPWHGPSLKELLDGITAERAEARPVASVHSIWELALHIELWARIADEALKGVPMPKLYGTEKDWPVVTDKSSQAWSATRTQLFQTGQALAKSIAAFSDERLSETVPGRNYDFYYLLHGIVQHSLYHGGQIALLKRAVAAREKPAD
jgi:DinB superfamily